MLDIKEKRHITVVGRGGASNVEWDDIQNKPDFAEVATSGDYDDLTNKPELFSGDYNDLTNKPDLGHFVEDTDLATVATTGSYNDLSNKPTIPAAPVQSDWNEADNTSLAYIQNKPTIPTVPPMTIETLTFTLQGGTVKTVDFYTKPMSANYFFVQDLSGMPNDVTIMCGDMIPNFDIYTSTDQTNWNYLGTTGDFVTLTETIPLNGKLYFKAVTDHWDGAIQISCLASHKIGGNIMSLLYGDNYFDTTLHPDYNINAFSALFMNDSELVDASDLVLPINTSNNCYQNMFSGCVSLTTAPALPATTLADYCYQNMFSYCPSLTQAPTLPATTLADYCYQQMFMECSSLNRIVTYAQDISATDCLMGWVAMVSGTGDFYNLGGATYPSGDSGIPSGWTEHNSL